MGFNIKKAWANAIEKTGNPLAPVLLQEAFGRVEQIGTMLAPICDQQKVEVYSQRLMGSWTDEELNAITAEPEFIMALAGMLSESLIRFGSKLGE